jgi:hypothetical protein
VFALYEDVDVVGMPFYTMEFLEGCICTDMSMPGVPPEVRNKWCVIFLFLFLFRRLLPLYLLALSSRPPFRPSARPPVSYTTQH